MTIVVAIDGPSGAGKSSTARAVATRAKWNYLDTGALYRGITWLALSEGISDPHKLVEALIDHPLIFTPDPKSPTLVCGNVDITEAIRSTAVTDMVSEISAHAPVRRALFDVQIGIIKDAHSGIVVEGRDIGTIVAPDAQLKIYLTADLEARALRRAAELDQDQLPSSEPEVAAQIEKRDEQDSTRDVSPLAIAEDAIMIDSTELSLAETSQRIWEILKGRRLLGLPIVALLGRPNVGKSTLINRFLGRREAIVEDTPGVTRDRVTYECEWNGKDFILMDTGGWEAKPDGISVGVSAGAESAMQEADVLAFVIDAQVGALDEDEVLVQELRKMKKPIVLIANKVDGPREEADAHALWNLGLGEPQFVSALHGLGSGDLLDRITKVLPEIGAAQSQDGFRRVALIGRPNVGKSSLLNILAGANRSLVDDVAGTTRDPVDELITLGGSIWRFIDTAGIRKRANQQSGTDYYATLRTQVALERAEVAVVVLDASVPISEQDLRIITMVEEAGKALILVMNKWDLVDEDRQITLDREIDRQLNQVEWAQRVNLAAKTGWHRDRLAPALRTALTSWERRVPTSRLNSFLGTLIAATPPPVRGGKQPKILYATQASIAPPRFVIFTTGFLEGSYRRFIERRLREEFGFPGTPVQVSVRVRERE
ncbi:MAG: ribosome biogenesis GTPase Der [Actinobacteria bacterium]|nr:ribosome biogenesis GTPase Der [Actinomycetota bacterium]